MLTAQVPMHLINHYTHASECYCKSFQLSRITGVAMHPFVNKIICSFTVTIIICFENSRVREALKNIEEGNELSFVPNPS